MTRSLTPSFVRARAPQQKADRRALLMHVASALFEKDGLIPTAAEVAKAAKVAKGTVYLYFKSKQEIFLALLESQFALFFDELAVQLSAQPLRSTNQVASAILSTLRGRQKLLPLAVLGPIELENNAPNEAILSYKRMIAGKMDVCATVISTIPVYSPELAILRMTQSYAVILGLFQLANHSKRLSALFKDHDLNALVPDFWMHLEDALHRLWREP